MKLNHECVRDLLLAIESLETVQLFNLADFYKNRPDLQQYTFETIFYTAVLLADGGYLNAKVRQFVNSSDVDIQKITWKGHEFLDNVRDDKVWNKTKSSLLEKVGSFSLSIASKVAADIILSLSGFK